jgi:hypothetical protein
MGLVGHMGPMGLVQLGVVLLAATQQSLLS